MNILANETAAVIRYSPSVCRTLLHHFKWNKETLLERFFYKLKFFYFFIRFYEAKDANIFFREACLLNPALGLLVSKTPKQCKICFDSQILTGLQCEHLFCFECWKGYLSCKVKFISLKNFKIFKIN